MYYFLTKRIFSSSSPFPYLHHHQLSLLTPLLLRHSLSTQPHQQQPKELPFLAQYLISSFAFYPHRALKYSAHKNFTAIKTSERPESVITFLKDTGLSHDQIRAVVSFYPLLLGSNVEKTLKPKVREFMDAGFSGELLIQIIRYYPHSLIRKNTLSRLLFWRTFVRNNDKVLLKTIQRNTLLFNYDIDKHILPVMNLLKEYGLSRQDIMSLLGDRGQCLKRSLDSLRNTLELIEELGISRGSRMFLCALKGIGGYSIGNIKIKVEFFTTAYGWSVEEVHAAFRKFPKILSLSENKVKSNMDFLIRKARFESRSIALQPLLLGCSVERVLIPRYTVISALEAKGLKNTCSFSTACKMSESDFLVRCLALYEKVVPGLFEAYAAAYVGKVPA